MVTFLANLLWPSQRNSIVVSFNPPGANVDNVAEGDNPLPDPDTLDEVLEELSNSPPLPEEPNGEALDEPSSSLPSDLTERASRGSEVHQRTVREALDDDDD